MLRLAVDFLRFLSLLALALIPLAQAVEAADNTPPASGWQGKLNAGASIADGNTQQRDYKLTAEGKRRDGDIRWSFDASYHFSEEADPQSGRFEASEDRSRLQGQYDNFFSPRSYLLLHAAAETDKLAQVDLRTTLGVGVGHQLITSPRLDYDLEAGVSYLDERIDGDTDDGYGAARLSHRLSYRINRNVELGHDAELFAGLDNGDDLYAQANSTLDIRMNERLFARLQWSLDWDKAPPAGTRGTDHRLEFSLGWRFGAIEAAED